MRPETLIQKGTRKNSHCLHDVIFVQFSTICSKYGANYAVWPSRRRHRRSKFIFKFLNSCLNSLFVVTNFDSMINNRLLVPCNNRAFKYVWISARDIQVHTVIYCWSLGGLSLAGLPSLIPAFNNKNTRLACRKPKLQASCLLPFSILSTCFRIIRPNYRSFVVNSAKEFFFSSSLVSYLVCLSTGWHKNHSTDLR